MPKLGQDETNLQADAQLAKELGSKLRSFRLARHKTIKETADGAQISPSLLSQVERGLATPSLATLRRVADLLNVPLMALFSNTENFMDADSDEMGRQVVVRANNRRRLRVDQPDIDYRLLTPDTDRTIEFAWITLEPRARTPHQRESLVSHPGEEVILCLNGTLHVLVNGRRYTLSSGDSIAIDSAAEHSVENPSDDEPSVYVSVIVNLPETSEMSSRPRDNNRGR